MAQSCLNGLVETWEVAEVARLVRLTTNHSPSPEDRAGHLLCDADLAILGGPDSEYSRYVAGVRRDYGHVSEADFSKGRTAVLRRLLTLDPLFRTPKGRELWADQAHHNLTEELATLLTN